MMVNNFTNINKTNNHLSLQTVEHQDYDVGNPGLARDRHKNVAELN